MENKARFFWSRPLPMIPRECISHEDVPKRLHEIDKTWKLPFPFTSIVGELIISCDVTFQPLARITHAPFYAELLVNDLTIVTRSLLHFKQWIKSLKKRICTRFQLEENEIIVLPTSIRISKLFDHYSPELSEFERKLFRHAITDIQAAKRALDNVRMEWLQ